MWHKWHLTSLPVRVLSKESPATRAEVKVFCKKRENFFSKILQVNKSVDRTNRCNNHYTLELSGGGLVVQVFYTDRVRTAPNVHCRGSLTTSLARRLRCFVVCEGDDTFL